MPPPKRVRRFDVVPSTPASPSVCPDCAEDLVSVAHFNSFHPVRDSRLVTKPSSEERLQSHACSSGDHLLQAKMVGAVAASV